VVTHVVVDRPGPGVQAGHQADRAVSISKAEATRLGPQRGVAVGEDAGGLPQDCGNFGVETHCGGQAKRAGV